MNMSGPNLSQYFANDPPSMFDEIGANLTNGKLSSVDVLIH